MLDAVLGAGITGAGSVPNEEQVCAVLQRHVWRDCDGVSPGRLPELLEGVRGLLSRGLFELSLEGWLGPAGGSADGVKQSLLARVWHGLLRPHVLAPSVLRAVSGCLAWFFALSHLRIHRFIPAGLGGGDSCC